MKNLPLVHILFMLLIAGQVAAQEVSWQELVNRKRFREVTEKAALLTAEDSTDFTKMSALAQACEGLLKYKSAFSYFHLCMQMDTANADILNALARTSVNLGKTDEAERYYLKALERESSNFYANYQLARLYFQNGDYGKAIQKYEQLLGEDGENTALLAGMADCYTKAGQMPFAAFYYEKAFKTNPENPTIASALVNTLMRMGNGNAEKALEFCDLALTFNPDNWTLRQNKGMALFINRKYSEADKVYTSLIDEDDLSYITLSFCGYSRYYSERYMDSIEPLEEAYEMDTTSIDVCLLLGSALGKTYDRKKAYTLLDRAESLMQPDSMKTLTLRSYRAETLQRDGRIDEAAALYYSLWLENNSRISALNNIANMYNYTDVSQFPDEKTCRKTLFAHVLNARECLKTSKEHEQILKKTRMLLASFIEEAFFKAENELPALSPDGKTVKINLTDLKAIINSIPN